jgi:hypothetical protein
MPLSPQQRERVLASIASGRLRLDPPQKMFAGFGEGRDCCGCGEVIDKTQVEYEAAYENGQSHHLHLGCAGLWDAERRRRYAETTIEDAEVIRKWAEATRERARLTAKESGQLRDRADVVSREAEAALEDNRKMRRGERLDKESAQD